MLKTSFAEQRINLDGQADTEIIIEHLKKVEDAFGDGVIDSMIETILEYNYPYV